MKAENEGSGRKLVKSKDGREVWEYDNGLQLDAASGRIVAPPQNTLMSSARASELSRARWRRAHAAARKGMIRGVKGSTSALEAWAGVVEGRAREAATGEGRSATEAARFVGQAAGFFGRLPEGEAGAGAAGAGVTLTMDVEVARRLIDSIVGERGDGGRARIAASPLASKPD